LFGSVKPEKSKWLTNEEIYKTIGMNVHAECIKGTHIVRKRNLENVEDRLTLVTQDLTLCDRQIT